MPIVKCTYCGKEIFKQNSVLKRTNNSFCSRTCKNLYYGKSKRINIIITNQSCVEMLIKSKKYGDKIVLLDVEDVDKIKNIKWSLGLNGSNNSFYVSGINCKDYNKVIENIRYAIKNTEWEY